MQIIKVFRSADVSVGRTDGGIRNSRNGRDRDEFEI